jgi:hypothetical protein
VVGKAQGAGPSGNEDPLPEETAKESLQVWTESFAAIGPQGYMSFPQLGITYNYYWVVNHKAHQYPFQIKEQSVVGNYWFSLGSGSRSLSFCVSESHYFQPEQSVAWCDGFLSWRLSLCWLSIIISLTPFRELGARSLAGFCFPLESDNMCVLIP